ncbi:MAG TPA: aminoacyl-tRNA hydrolase [Longimicrobiaceae bacterium]|nr:aminoacyl-tRNA hydrolase [Longimicrobiaceae bacterium]
MPRFVVCLGNPGAEYSTTRHNVGWWLGDRLAEVWGLGRFRREGDAAVAGGRVDGTDVRLIKPLTYMNRSGEVLSPLCRLDGFDPSRDLLIVVDDVALEPGRARFRAAGSAGGHNGLKSVEAALGTRDYARLRIGVGARPPGVDLVDWVLGSPSREDRQAIMALFPDLADCVASWITEGIETAMNRCNPGVGREMVED